LRILKGINSDPNKNRRVNENSTNDKRANMKKFSSVLLTLTAVFALQGCLHDDDDEATVPPPPPPPAPTTIVDVAVADGNFTTLVAALQATGLDATLADTSATFTVFAPTDAAFAVLGEETIAALLEDTDALSSILTYHVLSSEVNAESAIAAAGTTVETVNGANIGLSLIDSTLLVNTATVTATDIQTDNGIIHVIDAVLTPPAERGEPTANIIETAIAAGSFTTLVAAVQAAGLDGVLADSSQTFTVFAPTDTAFAMLGEETIATLLENPDVLSDILLQHVVAGEVDSVTAYSLNGVSPETASGATVPVAINPETNSLSFGGANVITTDIYTTNGIIHVIDMVIVGDVEVPAPARSIVDIAVEAGSFTTLVAALQATGLDSVLADTEAEFTVFAPTDAAFSLLGEDTINALLADPDALANILLYHVLPSSVLQDAAVSVAQSADNLVTTANEQQVALSLSGSTLFVNKSAVSSADILASNGVIHVVNQVIVPPTAKGEPTGSIVDVALGNPDFETLVAALTAANLVETLADETQTFTVFAPTDAAFAKIDSTVLQGLLSDVDALTGVLLQHVVGAEVSSLNAYAANGANVDTLSGNDVTVELVDFTAAANDESTEVAYDAANQRLISGAGTDNAGFTLYVFDDDLGSSGSNCIDGCATNWPPVIVSDGEVSSLPGLTTIERADGALQAAYKGRPLYFFAGDNAPGEANGQAANNVWWQVDQAQVALQIQGSNVITTDVYTTNGVIHVIDTVITETLTSN
jgi:uncharacterized surface protein with fasciclin (FAS1) repeats